MTSLPYVFLSLVFKRRTRFMWISNWRNYNAPEKKAHQFQAEAETEK